MAKELQPHEKKSQSFAAAGALIVAAGAVCVSLSQGTWVWILGVVFLVGGAMLAGIGISLAKAGESKK